MTQGWMGFLLDLAFCTATIFCACMAPVERRRPLWSTNFESDSQNGLQFLLCLASIQFQWLFLRKSIDFFLLLMKVDKYKNLVLRLMRCHCTLDFCFQINYSPIRSYWISFIKKLYASNLGEEGGTPLIFFFSCSLLTCWSISWMFPKVFLFQTMSWDFTSLISDTKIMAVRTKVPITSNLKGLGPLWEIEIPVYSKIGAWFEHWRGQCLSSAFVKRVFQKELANSSKSLTILSFILTMGDRLFDKVKDWFS